MFFLCHHLVPSRGELKHCQVPWGLYLIILLYYNNYYYINNYLIITIPRLSPESSPIYAVPTTFTAIIISWYRNNLQRLCQLPPDVSSCLSQKLLWPVLYSIVKIFSNLLFSNCSCAPFLSGFCLWNIPICFWTWKIFLVFKNETHIKFLINLLSQQ